MVPAVILSVIAFIAGKPVQVACDADVNPSPSAGLVATAWTLPGTNVIHAHPAFCTAASAPVGSDSFARAIDVFIHEATHARGIRSEGCAEMTADVGVYDVLRRFYGVPFFSAQSVRVGAQVLALSRTLPAIYQPETCWRSAYH